MAGWTVSLTDTHSGRPPDARLPWGRRASVVGKGRRAAVPAAQSDPAVTQWPRAIHSSRCGDSAPMVVESPWPVWTTVRSDIGSRRVEIDSMMVSKSE